MPIPLTIADDSTPRRFSAVVPQKNASITVTRYSLLFASAGLNTYASDAAMNDSTVGNHGMFSA